MEIQVLEGSFVEVSTSDGEGTDRRAFGEFVSHRGKLASYAFGWATGSEPHVARLSIEIGVGNPGGGTSTPWCSRTRTGTRSASLTNRSRTFPRAAPI